MGKTNILITGINGEMGQGLVKALIKNNSKPIIGLDLRKINDSIKPFIYKDISGDILDPKILEKLNNDFQIDEIYHLAALLSSKAEFNPYSAHEVNVGGTINLLKLAINQSQALGKSIKFFFPSSIAVYGLNGIKAKNKAGKITEDQHCKPETMYGCNKLYCEHLGRYYSSYYKRLETKNKNEFVDFRAIRFPGLISAHTLPTGGTTDYAPEMLHFAAQKTPYTCFVREDTKLPFMVMKDAIDSIINIMSVDKTQLSQTVYNISSFSASVGEFKQIIQSYYPKANIKFDMDKKRQSMVDSWPEDVDDKSARNDWNFSPVYNFEKAFKDYLIPEIRKQYA